MLAVVSAISLSLVLLHVMFQALYQVVGIEKVIFLRELFDLELEVSIPTWYSQTQLLLCALFAGMIALHFSVTNKKRDKRAWLLVTALMVFLSIDEGGGIHEQSIGIIQNSDRITGTAINPWVVYAVLVLAVVGVLFIRFFMRLPRRTKVLVAASAVIFVTGAFFMDMVGGGYVDRPALHSLFFIPVEEGLELLGIALLTYAFADYAKQAGVKLFTEFK